MPLRDGSNHQAAVHTEHLPGDVTGAFACQKHQQLRHLVRAAQAAHGGLLGQRGLILCRKGSHHIGVDDTRSHAVDGDAAGALLFGEGLGQADEARLGSADEVAKLLVFLAGEDAGYITGQVFGVNGGLVI